jgi:hypothetical protein
MRVRRMAPPRLGAAVVAAMVVLLGATGFLPGSAPAARSAPGSLVLQGRAILAPGVDHLRYSTQSPLNMIHVIRVKAAAGASIRPVLSGNRVIGSTTSSGLETTSSMCRRASAVGCVNGDFTACTGCTAPLGGVIRHGEVLRTPHPSWPQLSVRAGRLTAGQLAWTGIVRSRYEWIEQQQEQTKVLDLDLTGVNVVRPANGIVLYTSAYAARTGTVAGGTEVVLGADGRAALQRTVNLRVGAIGTGGNALIPSGGFVLSAAGTAEAALRSFWLETRRHPERLASVVLGMWTTPSVSQSLGGHPVILRGGQALAPAAAGDTASQVRHPRTVVGWNAAGDAWLVTIDGRQPGYSVGATYWEAASVLQQLGATEGINLDGGGSTTFVAKRCSGSLCVRNRPSDGRERSVTTALAVVPRR